jgi:hypothetical protein
LDYEQLNQISPKIASKIGNLREKYTGDEDPSIEQLLELGLHNYLIFSFDGKVQFFGFRDYSGEKNIFHIDLYLAEFSQFLKSKNMEELRGHKLTRIMTQLDKRGYNSLELPILEKYLSLDEKRVNLYQEYYSGIENSKRPACDTIDDFVTFDGFLRSILAE